MTLPTWVEPFIGLLPRRAIDWAEVHLLPDFNLKQKFQDLRVAFVKSEFCSHVYAQPGSSADLAHLARSTVKTFGPLSLFSRFSTSFFIIRLPCDPSCQIWREFYENDPDPKASARMHEAYRDLRPAGFPKDCPSQGELAVDPETIDWSKFHAVVVQDLCLPARITRRFPDVFWSYWIGETGTKSYRSSIFRPAEGYHAFLNGSSRRWRVRPPTGRHSLEFPYILQDSKTHQALGALPWESRQGILLEINTARQMPSEIRSRLEGFGPVITNQGSPSFRLEQIHRCRYFVQMASNRLWGNAMNEAVAAGCLALANSLSMPNNRSLMVPGLCPASWSELIETLSCLQFHTLQANALHSLQSQIADWFLCYRPIGDWVAMKDQMQRRRQA